MALLSWADEHPLPGSSTGRGGAVQGYVVAKGDRFYAVIYEGVDPITGRERRRWHAAGNDRDAAERLALVLATEAKANERSAGLSLGRYLLETWLPAKRMNLRLSTWTGYRNIIELHVIPRVGRLPLRRLRAHHLESLYADLLTSGRRDGRGGLDPKTVLEVHVVLHKALRDACKRGLVVRNVASDAEAPRRRRPDGELRAWTARSCTRSSRSHAVIASSRRSGSPRTPACAEARSSRCGGGTSTSSADTCR
jgi:hypothetical protein